jgi:broad specificity phosphatase PhoE/predicted kinase
MDQPLDPPSTDRLVVVMVGLPARGKTYIARKLARYLRWQGRRARVFNVGNYRRERLGAQQPADFFDPTNPEGVEARRQMAQAALDDMLGWLEREGEVGIYDATNSTRERRAWVRAACEAHGCRVLFVESVCDDPDVLEHNVRETKLRSPDYQEVDPERAVADFHRRIAMYARAYEPVAEPDASWVRIVDAGRQLHVNQLQGYLPSRIVPFLMNLHLSPRTIWLTRHGESAFNPQDRIGGNPDLTGRGRAYGDALRSFFAERAPDDLIVWTSTLHRTRQTAERMGRKYRPWKPLDEIDAGLFDGMTYAQVRATAPDEYMARAQDKLRYRYPRGESYLDVLQRLDPVLIELERQRRPVLIVAHNAVIRGLYAYFADEPAERVPHLDVPLHTLIELTPRAYGAAEERHRLRVEGG